MLVGTTTREAIHEGTGRVSVVHAQANQPMDESRRRPHPSEPRGNGIDLDLLPAAIRALSAFVSRLEHDV